jgi:hypothetical protein
MADKLLGKQLYATGWRQGTLLSALPWSVIYAVNDPLTRIAKVAKRQANNNNRHKVEAISTEIALPFFEVASGITHAEDYLVIISQDCDIAKDPNAIPTVFAMRAFLTENKHILQPAGGNSTQYFLFDQRRGLVADSTIVVPIEKPVLSNFTPQIGVPDEHTGRMFAKWVAHCFNRPAFPDEVVHAVIKPILDNVRTMQENGDPELEVLTLVKEVRVVRLIGDPPYEVRLIFIISEDGLPDHGLALARFVNRMREWFDPLEAKLVAWDASHLYEISAGDYMDTQQIYLDHYTYRGETIRGLVPPFYPM